MNDIFPSAFQQLKSALKKKASPVSGEAFLYTRSLLKKAHRKMLSFFRT
jgi:hypothetical protein